MCCWMRVEVGRPGRNCCSSPHGAHGGQDWVAAVEQVTDGRSAQADTSSRY